MDDDALARWLQLQLKPARGFAPKLPHIHGAILMARDSSLHSREACRRIPGIPQGAHNRVAELSVKVRGLLASSESMPAPDLQPSQSIVSPPPPAAASPPPADTDDEEPLPVMPVPMEQEQFAEIMEQLCHSTAASHAPVSVDDPTPATPPSPKWRLPPLPSLPAEPQSAASDDADADWREANDHIRAEFDGLNFDEVPEDARVDLDPTAWLRRESLRDPSLRKQFPKGQRHTRMPQLFYAIAAGKGHTNRRAARRYIRSFGYEHGIGPEPCDPDAIDGDCMFARGVDGKREVWKYEAPPTSSDESSDDECASTPEPGEPYFSSPENSDDDAAVESRRWEARPCDKCLRCGEVGHWASDCTAIVCGNCKQVGHRAENCPKPAPCFRCGELGHWAKECPQLCGVVKERPAPAPSQPENKETRWVVFQPPTLKTFRNYCRACDYSTTALTKKSKCMPRHKNADGEWCDGSGLKPRRREFISERPDPSYPRGRGGNFGNLGDYDAILDWRESRHGWRAHRYLKWNGK